MSVEALALLGTRWRGGPRFAGKSVEHELIALLSRLLSATDIAEHRVLSRTRGAGRWTECTVGPPNPARPPPGCRHRVPGRTDCSAELMRFLEVENDVVILAPPPDGPM